MIWEIIEKILTSANLSSHGQQENIELSTLIESEQIARQMDDVFTKLVFQKYFVKYCRRVSADERFRM